MWNISWEINLEKEYANSPLEAAEMAQEMMKETPVDWQFYIQDSETEEIFSVDLAEEEEQEVLQIKPSEYTPIIKK